MTWTIDTLLQAIDDAREIYVAVRLTEAVTYAALTQAAARDLVNAYHEARPDSVANIDAYLHGDVLHLREWPAVQRWTFAASHVHLLEHERRARASEGHGDPLRDDHFGEDRMSWTIEALNREHPLPEGWLWVMYEGDLIAMRRATDTRREFVCARDGELLADTIDTLNADAVSTAPPVDVALAVLLANKTGGSATDETASLRRQLEHYQQEARRAVAVQWATAHDSVHVWVDEDSTHDTDELTMRPSELDEALGDSVILITALQLRRLLAREVKDGPVARHYRDLLDASRAARDWVCEHGDADLPLAVRALVEAARPLRISDMIDMLARDEARSLRMRRAELREVIDRGGADAEAEAAAAELAEVDARLDEIPLGDTPEQAETWRVLHKLSKRVRESEAEKLATEAMPALIKQCAAWLGVPEASVRLSYGEDLYHVRVALTHRVDYATFTDVSGEDPTLLDALKSCSVQLREALAAGWEVCS